MTKRKALGSGLDSLLSSTRQTQITTSHEEGNLATKIQIHKIKRNQHQPRKIFKEEEIQQLAESIRQNGQIAPIVVRKLDDSYELIVGERRWRASQLLRKDTPGVLLHTGPRPPAPAFAPQPPSPRLHRQGPTVDVSSAPARPRPVISPGTFPCAGPGGHC